MIKYTIKGKGEVEILKFICNTWIEGLMQNVLFVPDLKKKLFSESTVANKGMKIIKDDKLSKRYNRDVDLVATAVRPSNNLCQMLFQTIKPIEANTAATDSISA